MGLFITFRILCLFPILFSIPTHLRILGSDSQGHPCPGVTVSTDTALGLPLNFVLTLFTLYAPTLPECDCSPVPHLHPTFQLGCAPEEAHLDHEPRDKHKVPEAKSVEEATGGNATQLPASLPWGNSCKI